MTYTAPTAEQRFVLDHIARVGELGVDAEMLDAVLDGAGAFAAGRGLGGEQGAEAGAARVAHAGEVADQANVARVDLLLERGQQRVGGEPVHTARDAHDGGGCALFDDDVHVSGVVISAWGEGA